MPRQNKRQTQLPGQKRISDFFGKADDKPADTPSGVKRAIVDEPAEPNKKQMTMSCSDTGEGLASVSEYLLAPSPPSPSYETKTNASLPKEALTRPSYETKTNSRLPKEALTSPSDETKTNTRLPKEALTSPSDETKTTLESFRVIPSSQDELDDEEMSFETSTDGTLVSPMSVEKSSASEQDSSSTSMVTEHHGDDSDEEVPDENVGNALIDDDEYIPFEGEEEEDEDSGIAALVNATESDPVAQSNNETTWNIFEPRNWKAPIKSADTNAEQWVKQYDESHPVDKDDEDLNRFEAKFSRFIERITQWASETAEAGWYRLPRGDREMTLGFHSLFQRAAANPAALVRICLDGMPRKVRQVLGKEDLSEIDFLDLPAIPSVCKHRLVYVDVATRLHQEQIKSEVRNRGNGHKPFKTPMPACDLKEALEAKLYVGSSVNRLGSYNRIREHEAIANGHFKAPMNMHYKETSKPDVLCNFRLIGVWQNPYADKSYDGQDPSRWIAPMVEGLMMVYLGLYTEKNKSHVLPQLFPASSYRLVNRARNGLALPDFSDGSLNRAWSICQGTSGSAKLVQLCANPECRRPRALSETTPVGTKPTVFFGTIDSGDLMAPFYCSGCRLYYHTYGTMRVREGLATGRWRHESDFDAINQVWLADGHDRKCQNAGCRVLIHSAANLYGIENGIKCLRCHSFALLHHEDYAPVRQEGEQTGDCQVCQKQDVRIFSWDKIDLRNDPNLPTELCGNCYITRCSFLQDEVPANSRPKTVAGCGNVACWDMTRRQKADRSSATFIENIKDHIWRCARCDYCHQIGVEKPSKQLQNLPKPPIGPVASHRFNATKCVDCERYSSYTEWEKVDGGYRCGGCAGLKCSDCNGDPAIYPVRVRADGQARCFRCHEDHRHGNKGVRETAYQKVSANRTCCNVHCNMTGSDDTQWFFNPADKTQYRCRRCNQFFKKHGKDWCPDAKCYNNDCTESGSDMNWYTGPDGNIRCRPCQTAFVMTGAERPLKGRCSNFSICGRDHTNFSGGFTCDGKGDGNVRCSECHRFWVDKGRQFERDPNLPRLTKAEIEARFCSRPGCNARSSIQFFRWKEYVPDGWLCKRCFKIEKAAQQQANRAAYAARMAAATATAASQQQDPGDPDAFGGPATDHDEA